MGFADRFRNQSRAERRLITEAAAAISHGQAAGNPARILNVGAGADAVIENRLGEAGGKFICDRVDVIDCRTEHPNVGNCWTCSAESMGPVPSGAYSVVFANFVLEHLKDIRAAAGEISRVLAPGGRFVATVPNPAAPEFVLAKRMPSWFGSLITCKKPSETHYSYRTIPQLTGMLAAAGMKTISVKYFCCVADYLAWLPLISSAARLYDRAVAAFQHPRLMGHACIVMKKPA